MPSCYVVITLILPPVLLSVKLLSPSQEIRVLTPLLRSGKVRLHNRPTQNVTSLLIQRRKMIKLNKEMTDSLREMPATNM
jgi:hypothetical protein